MQLLPGGSGRNRCNSPAREGQGRPVDLEMGREGWEEGERWGRNEKGRERRGGERRIGEGGGGRKKGKGSEGEKREIEKERSERKIQ